MLREILGKLVNLLGITIACLVGMIIGLFIFIVIILSEDVSRSTGRIDGHAYVDFGLPSG